jgi:SpoVK/Ycf46/Vps4 family AAA+-type ATPase
VSFLGNNIDDPPPGLSLEKPAKSLAALVANDAFAMLESNVLAQWERQEDFAGLLRYGITPINRVLFYGPPGNGKTFSAQVIASRLDCPLYRVACETLVASHLGQTTGNMGRVMDWLSEQEQCVVLLDEVETIFPNRATIGGDSCSMERQAALTCFWQRLDRWDSPQLFILATNLREKIDTALQSRIELKIEFGPPSKDQALLVLEYWTETLHEYGSDVWGPPMLKRIKSGKLPGSFRELWQAIAIATRTHVTTQEPI